MRTVTSSLALRLVLAVAGLIGAARPAQRRPGPDRSAHGILGADSQPSSGCATACRSSATARTRTSRSGCASPKATRRASGGRPRPRPARRGHHRHGGKRQRRRRPPRWRLIGSPSSSSAQAIRSRAGLVKSLARPGGNITGIADLDVELVPKRMEIFRELVPGAEARAVRLRRDECARSKPLWRVHRDAARAARPHAGGAAGANEEEARAAISGSSEKGDADGIFSPRVLSLNIPGFILEAAPAKRAADDVHDPFFVERGGLASYAASPTSWADRRRAWSTRS